MKIGVHVNHGEVQVTEQIDLDPALYFCPATTPPPPGVLAYTGAREIRVVAEQMLLVYLPDLDPAGVWPPVDRALVEQSPAPLRAVLHPDRLYGFHTLAGPCSDGQTWYTGHPVQTGDYFHWGRFIVAGRALYVSAGTPPVVARMLARPGGLNCRLALATPYGGDRRHSFLLSVPAPDVNGVPIAVVGIDPVTFQAWAPPLDLVSRVIPASLYDVECGLWSPDLVLPVDSTVPEG